MNLSPDLIHVFKNAGHLLGLVATGLEAGEVTLKIEPLKTRAYFIWKFTSKRGTQFEQAYCVLFGLLDRALPDELLYQAGMMLEHWHQIAGVDKSVLDVARR